MNLKLIILFGLISSAFITVSSAETITGSSFELINGSGDFTWTSQNFPALRDGDTIKMNITNNVLKSGDLVYTMNSYPISDLFLEVFSSSESLNGNSAGSVNLMKSVNFLFNKYYIGSRLYTILINTNNFKLHGDDKIKVYTLSIVQDFFDNEGNGKAMINSCGRMVIEQGFVYLTCTYEQVPMLWFYSKKIANKEHEIKGIIFVNAASYAFLSKPIDPSEGNTFGKLKITKNRLSDCCSTPLLELTNYEDISISGNTISIADNFNIEINSNSLYPSANVDSTLNVEFVPYPTPSPTPIPTTPLQTPTSTATVSPLVTPTPTITKITTPAPTTTSQVEQEVKEIKERLNKVEEKQTQLENEIPSTPGFTVISLLTASLFLAIFLKKIRNK